MHDVLHVNGVLRGIGGHQGPHSTIDLDRHMSDAVVEAISQHRDLLDKERVQNVVRSHDLCFDLMMRLRNYSRGPFGYR